MAPGIMSPVPGNITSPLSSKFPGGSRKVSSMSTMSMFDSDTLSNGGMSRPSNSRRESSFFTKKFSAAGSSKLTGVIQNLQRDSGAELGSNAHSILFNTNHSDILNWIANKRMNDVPAEGSSYDKVLAWAQLFVERLHSFDVAIRDFEGSSLFAAQLSYGYCLMLLQLPKENATALMTSFGFFHSTSSSLVNLLERTELFAVSQEIKDQLVEALADLVSLVAGVSTHFHQSIDALTEGSISINIYETFTGAIESFRERCAKISDSMWRHQLVNDNKDPQLVSVVKSIRSWLSPEDRVLSHLAENTSHLAHEREEMTCLWMDPYLTHFLKSNKHALAFTGAPGSGKTVLASVIVDRLHDHIGGVTYKSLFIPINARIPAETTPIAVAKTIFFQLFEKRIGNVKLLQILHDAYDLSKRTTDEGEYENILWRALEEALAAALARAKDLVIVVDGVDEASCGEAHLLQKLITATANGTNVKLITLGAEKPQTSVGVMQVPVSGDRITDDISTVVRSHFSLGTKAETKNFLAMDEMEQETLVDQISEASRGSFLWAKLCTKRARQEHTPEDVRKLVDTLVKNKPTIADFVFHAVQSPNVTEDAKHMLLWLATADRPLLTRELIALSSVQVDKQTVVERKLNVRDTIKPLKSLIFMQDGQVYLRHGLIRTAVLDVFSKGKLVPTVKDRHSDLVTRLLVYIKHAVPEQHEPSPTPLDGRDVTHRVKTHPLLDFAVRYWPRHLKQTATYTTGGDAPTAKEFGKIFPVNVSLLLLQTTLWGNLSTPTLLSYYTTVTNLCREVFTTKSPVTLQSIMSLAIFYRELNQAPQAVHLFYEITTLSKTLLGTTHTLTMEMARFYLDLTVDSVTTTKSEIMTKREELLIIIIECYQVHYGEKSEKTISLMKKLIEHYRMTKEEQKIQTWTQKIHHLTTTTTSYDADDSRDLSVRLKGYKQDIGDTGISFLLHAESDEAHEKSQSFEGEITQADKYIAEGCLELAERLYIELWQRATTEDHKLRAVLAYTKFLKTQKRETEASSILSSVWEEHKNSTHTLSETSTSHFEEIAKVMTTVGLTVAALSIFKHCASFYQRTNRSSSHSEVQKYIASTYEHVTKQASTSTSGFSESTLEEIVYETSNSSRLDESSTATIRTLLTIYTKEHRWKDATRVLKKVLRGVWPSLFAASIQDVVLPTERVNEILDLTERLAQCYHYRRRFPREEGIRVRVYRAVRAARPVDDKLRETVKNQLITFYERSSQPDQVINTYQEVLDDYTKHYNPDHATVIATLYTLAKLTSPRPVFVEYYQRIILAINKDPTVIKPEALEPIIIVATELWTQTRYSDAVQYFALLFTTFLNQPKQSPKFQDESFVQQIFDRYTHCLRSKRTEFSTIHKVTVDFHSKVKTVFSATATITIQATLTLAKVCQETKTHEGTAIALYEELLKLKPAGIDLEEIEATLDGIFEEQTATATSKSQTISSEQKQRVTKVLRKRIESTRSTYGWAHEESLSKLQEFVSFHSKQNDTQVVTKELHETTKQILTSQTSSERLVAAATTIAASYIATNQTHKAVELTEELYRQIVMKDTSKSKESQLEVSSNGRQSLAFLAQLQQSLRHGSSSITEILASLTTEYVYFEEFRSVTKSKSSTFHSVSVSATRLYNFLLSNKRQDAANHVFNEFVAYFSATEGKRIKLTQTAQVKIFLITIIDYLTKHQTSNFVRSVGIAANTKVLELLDAKNFKGASNLAIAAFAYISAHDVYRTPEIVKFVFTLGVLISGHSLTPQPDAATLKELRGTSGLIMQEVLRVIVDLKINLAQINLDYLNILIGLLGEQQDYKNLVWILGDLWNSRHRQSSWTPAVTLDLARRYILARYLVGDKLKASRLAEDIVYNCRRVNGARHPSTLEMSTLLSQLYTAIAQRYQAEKNGQHLANKYYKKSAGVHESLLRVFVDPSLAEFEGALDGSFSMDGSTYDINMHDQVSDAGSAETGDHARAHLQLFKLSVQRIGDWPKDYDEYKSLNDDLFRLFGEELKGVEGVEKWNLKDFGAGKASSSEDTLDVQNFSWSIELGQQNGDVEEEL
ncbi:unnamed protein product [Penicillium salamii]|uniref:Nephrocystin 3-like N-terminal domain-containing protein n=1 Tax=Penicillium salamii TaxID=1612424 RepID=A0A9W4NQ23_9EURO|nr:unnamed protein product [Penicillium salamii]CAG8353266.1 unnamed protein product [Penicillium salamii]CAG8358114.1 unnamed protein product [Penicillium salamii]CAG8403005.1 unnamed protein product [Penicillium salamii]